MRLHPDWRAHALLLFMDWVSNAFFPFFVLFLFLLSLNYFLQDVFVTRVAPSKTFDLLKEDFDYMLISIVLVALSVASVVVKHLSARKAIKQAWK